MEVKRIEELFAPECQLCPRECGVHRREGEAGYCGVRERAVVASSFAHRGEENCLSGTRGSGTIFFSGCNLKCVFCQNANISHRLKGKPQDESELCELMLKLENQGCHNINLVTPTHSIAQIISALKLAKKRGLSLPVVYNCGGYESPETIDRLEGMVDIYMPDFKFWSPESGKQYMNAKDYPEKARESIKKMHEQVGDLELDRRGIAQKGLLIRHLVMPGYSKESKKILEWIKNELSPKTYLNIMAQYRPAHQAHNYPKIDQTVSRGQYRELVNYAREIGLTRLD